MWNMVAYFTAHTFSLDCFPSVSLATPCFTKIGCWAYIRSVSSALRWLRNIGAAPVLGLLAGVLRAEMLAGGPCHQEILMARDLPRVRLWVGNALRGLIPAHWVGEGVA